MSDPIVRARNGDTEYFKRVAVDEILNLTGEGEGDSVLSTSVVHNHIYCSKVILQRCPSLLYQQSRLSRYTALHHAAWRGIPAIIKLLIHGAEKKLFRMLDCHGDTPMQKAVSNNKIETVELLIQADPDYEFPLSNIGENPLLAALRFSYGKTSADISVKIRQLLLEKQPNQCKLRTGDKGWTALHHATYKGDLGAIQDIIQFCPDCMDLVDKQGHNFLHIAAEYEHVEVVEYLVRKKGIAASILNGVNNIGNTPLDIAAKTGNRKIFSSLRHGLDLTFAGYPNETDTMTEREKELCIPPPHLELYRHLVQHFGEIVAPELSLSLEEFVTIVAEMLEVTPDTATQEQVSVWEKKVAYYTVVGLQVSWLRKHVTQFIDWLAWQNENISRLEDEITAKKEVFDMKYAELTSLKEELTQLQHMRDEYIPTDFEFTLFGAEGKFARRIFGPSAANKQEIGVAPSKLSQ